VGSKGIAEVLVRILRVYWDSVWFVALEGL